MSQAELPVQWLMGSGEEPGSPVFSDGRFRRDVASFTMETGTKIEIVTDTVLSCAMRHNFVSVSFDGDGEVEFRFLGGSAQRCARGVVIRSGDGQRLLWLPRGPVAREYEQYGRIVSETSLPPDVRQEGESCVLRLRPSGGRCVELAAVCFMRDTESVLRQIEDVEPVETVPVGKARWFRYTSLCDAWDSLVRGDVYKTRNAKAGKAWPDQQLALTLYRHLAFLAGRTVKILYEALAELIAYEVLLSMPQDGRWRHGAATDLMETHLRHQIDGIHLLLCHYQKTGQSLFLKRAQQGADVLLNLAQPLQQNGLWFLHDSLECRLDDARLGYRSLQLSRAFGKSESNTLCLNTHVWTLVLLHRLNQIEPQQRYEQAYDAGLRTLETVLKAGPGTIRYGAAYKVRELLIRVALRTGSTKCRNLLRRCETYMEDVLLPRWKRDKPRLRMPGGYIERDLCASCLSDGYHFVTLRDLLVLYLTTGSEWLRPIIDKSVRFTLRSRLAEYRAPYEPRAAFLVDILWLYAYAVHRRPPRYLPDLMQFFLRHDLLLSADLLGSQLTPELPEELFAEYMHLVQSE